MPRIDRSDTEGAWHHVVNRGQARRPVFETRADIRYFLALLARVVRAGSLEVHAWAILTTHFHLLVRSPAARLSSAMGWVELQYVRWFNRGRRRDGSLFRGRFKSRFLENEASLPQVVRYIDDNPVKAGLAREPVHYPYCSAHWYGKRRGPPWMARGWVERQVCGESGAPRYDPARYRQAFDRLVVPQAPPAPPQAADLIQAATPAALRHLRRSTRLADGLWTEAPPLPAAVEAAIATRHAAAVAWRLRGRKRSIDPWPVLRAGLLRCACGLTLAEIARRLEVSVQRVHAMVAQHRELLRTDPAYLAQARQCADLARRRIG